MLTRSVTRSSRLSALRYLSAGSGGYHFELTDDQKAFQLLARTFAQEEVIPVAAKYDKSMAFPHDVFEKAWKLGLVNAHIPQEYGGLGLHTVGPIPHSIPSTESCHP